MEVDQCDTYPQNRPERGFRKLQACQPDIGAQENYGTDYLECITLYIVLILYIKCITLYMEAQPAQFVKGRSCLTNRISFYDW